MNNLPDYSDNDIFNEYWRVVCDINERESAHFYEHEVDKFTENEAVIDTLCELMTELSQEAMRRKIDLSWY